MMAFAEIEMCECDESGFQPFDFSFIPATQSVGLGWDNAAPLALKKKTLADGQVEQDARAGGSVIDGGDVAAMLANDGGAEAEANAGRIGASKA